MPTKKTPKHQPVLSANDRAKLIKKKAASASTNESSMASGLKNSEHGYEEPER